MTPENRREAVQTSFVEVEVARENTGPCRALAHSRFATVSLIFCV